MKTRKQTGWLAAGILAIGILPAFLFWLLFGRAPAVDVRQAKALLASNSDFLLLDVRAAAAFAAHHVNGAFNWPFDDIMALTNQAAIPAEVHERKLLVICESGLSSAMAAQRLKTRFALDTRNVIDGMEAWRTAEQNSGDSFRAMSTFEQWVAVFTAFGVKPLYMIVCLALIIALWRQRAADTAALRWGLIWFWLGENACTVNWLFYEERSHGWEYLHSYGMIVGFSFVAWALLEATDMRLVKVSAEHERCAALGLCRGCIKNGDRACKIRLLFKLLIPAGIVVALMPLSWNMKAVSYNTRILGTLYHYGHYVIDQIYEGRFCVVLSVVLLGASWLVLMIKKEPVSLSKILFAGGVGPMSFGLMRTFLLGTYSDRLVWFVAWEEITELIFVASIAVVLWVFRGTIFREPSMATAEMQ